MQNINIVYLENGHQFSDGIIEQQKKNGWLASRTIPLDVLCQLQNKNNYDSKKHTVTVIHNLTGEVPAGAINLFPIDFQSSPISYEGPEQSYTLSDFGTQIDKKIAECVSYNLPNTVFLIYSSTEPYFFNTNMYVYNLSMQYPDVHFVLSGSGETDDYFGNYETHLKPQTNVSKIHKLWYLDRVHYITSILGKGTHIDLNQTIPQEHLSDYGNLKNKFLLTMRNCRSHRLLISYFMETKGYMLNDVTYSRNFSMNPGALLKIYNNPETISEFPYHVHLMTTAMNDLMKKEKLTEQDITGITKTLYRKPHVIDLKDLNDRGAPGPWLYNTAYISLIPGGEPYGYGCVDEKQMIPMYFKKPFITVGCKGIYEELRRLDFKTFDTFWDTSFNTMDTLKQRVQGFYQTIDDIRKLHGTLKKLKQLETSVQDDVNHNYKNITTGKFRRRSNDDFFKEIINACS